MNESGPTTQWCKKWWLEPVNSSFDRWLGLRFDNRFGLDLGFLEIAHSGIDQELAVTDTLDPCLEHASSSFRNNTN